MQVTEFKQLIAMIQERDISDKEKLALITDAAQMLSNEAAPMLPVPAPYPQSPQWPVRPIEITWGDQAFGYANIPRRSDFGRGAGCAVDAPKFVTVC